MKFKKSFLFISMLLCVAHLNAMEKFDLQLLIDACEKNDKQQVDLLIKEMTNTDLKNIGRYDLDDIFFPVGRNGYHECLKILLSKFKTKKNFCTQLSFNALIRIVLVNDNVECLKLLLELKEDNFINEKVFSGSSNKNDLSILNIASSYTMFGIKCIKYLVELGADVNIREKASGKTPLHNAKDNFECIKYLVELGADVNAQDSCGDTALHKLVNKYKCDSQSLRLLIKNTNIYLKNNEGRIPLSCALLKENYEYIYWLLFNEIDLDKLKKNLNKAIEIDTKIEAYIRNLYWCNKYEFLKTIRHTQKKIMRGPCDDDSHCLKFNFCTPIEISTEECDREESIISLFYAAAFYDNRKNIYLLLHEIKNENVFKKAFNLAKTKEVKHLISSYYLYLENKDKDVSGEYKKRFNIFALLSIDNIDGATVRKILCDESIIYLIQNSSTTEINSNLKKNS